MCQQLFSLQFAHVLLPDMWCVCLKHLGVLPSIVFRHVPKEPFIVVRDAAPVDPRRSTGPSSPNKRGPRTASAAGAPKDLELKQLQDLRIRWVWRMDGPKGDGPLKNPHTRRFHPRKPRPFY